MSSSDPTCDTDRDTGRDAADAGHADACDADRDTFHAEVYLDILRQYWGYNAFRGIQEDIIRSVAQGRDTLGLMPTGGGKSIAFQVPALAMEGTCIVVTPLIALMKDQVQNLRRRGIRATAIHAGMSRQEVLVALDNCILGDYKFLYIAPERVDSELFQRKLRHMRVSLLTVDEAHCISQWGYDFRPAYLQVARLRQLLPPRVPVLALTATATTEVAADIQRLLAFRQENVCRMSFQRPNLTYVVRYTDDKGGELLRILERVPGSAIVYVRSRKRTRETALFLQQHGIAADYYHAGLDHPTRDLRQQQWTEGTVRVIVATNAFGMGIDKPDVRVVIHIDLPDSPEAYFQEAGRAGRDGQPAYAVALYNPSEDRYTLALRTALEFPPKVYIYKVYDDLQGYYQMAMGDGRGCVRQLDLDDFCRKFHHFPPRVEKALHFLAQTGFLEYLEEPESASRLMFIVRRDELYRLQGLAPDLERLIYDLLRIYTGLFAEFAYINEQQLARRLGLTPDAVYQMLLQLSRLRIVHYVPQARLPRIVYRRERVDTAELIIPPEVYELRYQRQQHRVQAMMHYVTANQTCRSRLLLAYFGETHTPNCGHCDVCLNLHLKPTDPVEPIAPNENMPQNAQNCPQSDDNRSGVLPHTNDGKRAQNARKYPQIESTLLQTQEPDANTTDNHHEPQNTATPSPQNTTTPSSQTPAAPSPQTPATPIPDPPADLRPEYRELCQAILRHLAQTPLEHPALLVYALKADPDQTAYILQKLLNRNIVGLREGLLFLIPPKKRRHKFW